MESKLYVGNLSYNSTDQDLRELFSQAGEIQEVSVVMDRYTSQPKGFAFVQMVQAADAQKAIEMFNGKELDGRRLVVNVSRPREQSSNNGHYRAPHRQGGSRRYR